MSWFSKDYSRPVEKAPSKYRIVPKGENSWGIQEYTHGFPYSDNKYEYRDTYVIYNDTYVYFANFTYFENRQGYKYFSQGTMEECKSFIDRRVEADNRIKKIKDREADTSLYLDYP